MNAVLNPPSADWLAELCRPAFEARYLGCEPFVLNGIARSPESDLDWSQFEPLFASPEMGAAPAGSGEVNPKALPMDLNELSRHFPPGLGLTVPGADRHCAVLRALRASVERQLGHTQVHLSAAPARTRVEWGYDEAHKFILQTCGMRDVYFRANTVMAHPSDASDSCSAFAHERSRLWMARLSAGDLLYLPARWWHRTECIRDSVTITLDVHVNITDSSGESQLVAEDSSMPPSRRDGTVSAGFF